MESANKQESSPSRTILQKTHCFSGKGLLSLETISIDKHSIIYKKKASLFSPMLTITFPRLNIRNVEFTETLTGALLKITTLSNNNIHSRNFTRNDIRRIKAILEK